MGASATERESARRYFLHAYRRFVASLALLALLTVAVSWDLAWQPALVYCARRAKALGLDVIHVQSDGDVIVSCPVPELVGYETGPWVYGLRQPVVEQFALLVVELVTWPPVTVVLAFGTLATAILLRYPGLSRYPLPRTR